jgi:hypothetical protein
MSKLVRSSIIAALLIGAAAVAPKSELPRCARRLDPVEAASPKLPARLHNEYEGTAVVAFELDRSGQVHAPVIVSQQWRPIGHRGRAPIGYREAILAAVSKWRFAPQATACKGRTVVSLQLDSQAPPHVMPSK